MNTVTIIIVCIIVAIIFSGLGVLLAATKLRTALTKKSSQVLLEAEDKAEIVKKEKILQAKEKFLQLKNNLD